MKKDDKVIIITERKFAGNKDIESIFKLHIENVLEKLVSSSYDSDEIGTTSLEQEVA